MPEAVFIPADLDKPVTRINVENLEDYQAAVGGFIEVVYYNHPAGTTLATYLNEEGKLKGLPMNPRATAFIRSAIHPGDYIAGDAFVLEADLDTGEDQNCPALEVEVVRG